jgi:hypothetical protein
MILTGLIACMIIIGCEWRDSSRCIKPSIREMSYPCSDCRWLATRTCRQISRMVNGICHSCYTRAHKRRR